MTLRDDAQNALQGLLEQITLSQTLTTAASGNSGATYTVMTQMPAALAGPPGPIKLPIIDPVPEVTTEVDFTLNLVMEQVRFALDALSQTDPLAAPTPIGGMPIEASALTTPLMATLASHATEPGVPGVLSRLSGQIKLPVTPAVPGQGADVSLSVDGDVVEEKADGSRPVQSGAATSLTLPGTGQGTQPPLTTVMLPAPAIQKVALTPQLPSVVQRKFALDATFTLSGSVAATDGSGTPLDVTAGRTISLDLPPVPWPVVPIPTVAILTDTTDFALLNGGDPAKVFVILPFGQLPGDGPSVEHHLGVVPALSGLLSTLEGVHSTVGSVIGPLASLIQLLTPGSIASGIDLGSLLSLNLNGQPGTGQIIRYGETEFPHLENYDWNHGDFSDTARSVLLIGPPGTKLELFNAATIGDDSEGTLILTTGDSCIVAVRNLGNPAAEAAQGSVTTQGNVGGDKFDKQVSSARLTVGHF